AKRRYDMQLVKEDEWYIYIKVMPRLAADKAEFQQARLVLNQNTLLPRELWFVQPDQVEVLWDIPRIDTKAHLNRQDFSAPTIPNGGRMEQVPKPTKPAR